MTLRLFFLLCCFLISQSLSASVDNAVEGDPEIECGPQAITVNFNTKNTFEGHVFVKGLYKDAGCRNDDGGNRVAGINLPFDSCQVRRTRSLNPRGVYISVTVVISFHPQFITMVDRAYRIQCFYMEADKTVSQDLAVSMLTTSLHTQAVPMPVCTYTILDSGPTGEPLKHVTVGQQVYHKWACDTETTDTFCMTVHSCYVDDGAGDRVDLLDPEGCAQDKYLLPNLDYQTELMAGQSTMVFKYADRPTLMFNCQISMTIKEPNQECPRATCAEPSRGKRSLRGNSSRPEPGLTMDVTAELESMDVREAGDGTDGYFDYFNRDNLDPAPKADICLSHAGLGLVVGMVGLVVVSALVVTSFMCLRR